MPDVVQLSAAPTTIFDEFATHARNVERPVALIGFQRQGNLGVGYLASTLTVFGYRVDVIEFEQEFGDILASIRAADPAIVGFSLIFQFHIRRFEHLARYLRAHGVTAHFTIGGHFPSLSAAETLRLMPQLDSVVQYEGELTLLDLADALSTGRPIETVAGLVLRGADDVIATPPRGLLPDLDLLPHPHRTVVDRSVLGRHAAQLLASRGCIRTCSFCSIHMFYRSAPGKVVRTRSPAEVAREMRMLYDDRDVTIFMFQDDDFPIAGATWHKWCREFLAELRRQDLVGSVLWKINCRADVVEDELFAELRDHGLYLVYMGLESGTETGLTTLNKRISVAQNRLAVDILKRLGIMFDFGFMMLEPSSTFDTIRENVRFLRDIVGDGSASAEFCRMVPYDGTPIKVTLQEQGRLRGDVCNPDYDFLDGRLDAFFDQVNRALNVTGWIHGLKALSPALKYAWNEVAVMRGLTGDLDGLPEYCDFLRRTTRESNEVLFEVVESLADSCERGTRSTLRADELAARSGEFRSRLERERNAFVSRHETELVAALVKRELAPA